MSIQLAAEARTAEADATTPLMDGGRFDIYSGSPPDVDQAATGTLLASLTMNATAFAAATDNGTQSQAVANAISGTTGITNGVAGYFRILKSNLTTAVIQGVITGSGGGGDLEVGNTSIATGQAVDITNYTYGKSET